MIRIVISGCSSGGKSTLLQEMERRGFVTVPEPGRLIVQEQLSQGGRALPWVDLTGFLELCLLRAREQYESVRTVAAPVIFDRSAIDTITAIEWLTGSPLPEETEILDECQYSSPVYLASPWEAIFTMDDERRHSFKDACGEYTRLLRSYQKHGFIVSVLSKTSVKKRADYLEGEIESQSK